MAGKCTIFFAIIALSIVADNDFRAAPVFTFLNTCPVEGFAILARKVLLMFAERIEQQVEMNLKEKATC